MDYLNDWSETRMHFIASTICSLILWVMKNAVTGLDVSLEWTNGSHLCDLDEAEDIILLEGSCTL